MRTSSIQSKEVTLRLMLINVASQQKEDVDIVQHHFWNHHELT